MQRIPIVDAHQHFWDLGRNYHPWLRDEPMIPFRYGDYSALKRDYLPADYLADSAGFEVRGSVYVEAEWDPRDPLGETRWVSDLAAREGYPKAVVAQAWLDRDDAAQVLAAQAAMPLVRGVRHKPAAAPAPGRARASDAGSMLDPRWRAGYARLAPLGLHFELQVPWWHLDEAAELAARFPETTIILNHTGLPGARDAAGLDGWRAAMRALAVQPNVAVKISGLGLPGQTWSVAANRTVVLEAIALFGVARCMFASNFPVDRLCVDFATLWDGFFEVTAHLGGEARARLFHDNAVHYYRL